MSITAQQHAGAAAGGVGHAREAPGTWLWAGHVDLDASGGPEPPCVAQQAGVVAAVEQHASGRADHLVREPRRRRVAAGGYQRPLVAARPDVLEQPCRAVVTEGEQAVER